MNTIGHGKTPTVRLKERCSTPKQGEICFPDTKTVFQRKYLNPDYFSNQCIGYEKPAENDKKSGGFVFDDVAGS